VQQRDAGGQRPARRLDAEVRHGRALGVEAVLDPAPGVELREGQGGRAFAVDDGVQPHAVPGQPLAELAAEAVAGDRAEERDRLPQAARGPGGVERPAARVGHEPPRGVLDQIHEGLAGHDDQPAAGLPRVREP